MTEDYLVIDSRVVFKNEDDTLIFTVKYEIFGNNPEVNIYADNLLIYSITNPIEEIQSCHVLPLHKCQNIIIESNNVRCTFNNFSTIPNIFKPITNNFSKSKSVPKDKYLDKVIVMMSDDNGEKWLERSIESLRSNNNLKDINLAIVNLNASKRVKKICERNDAIEVTVYADTERMMLCKGSLYSIGNILLAEKYLFIDIDTLILEDITTLLSRIDITSGINICQEGGNHGLKKLDELLSNNQTPYFSSNDDCKDLVPYIKNKTVINAGIYSGDRKSILQLESKIRQLEHIGLKYINSAKGIDWREQAVFNVALSHNNNFNILPQAFNFQMLNEKNKSINEIKDLIKTNKTRILHFNGDYGKQIYEKFNDLTFTPKYSFNTGTYKVEDRLNFDKKYSINQIQKILNDKIFNKNNILIIDTEQIPEFIKGQEKLFILESHEEKQIENLILTNNIFLKIKLDLKDKYDLVFIHNKRERRNSKIIVNLAKNLLKNDGILVIESEDTKEKIIDKNDIEFNYLNLRYEVYFGN